MISEVIKHALAREEALFCSEQPGFRVLLLKYIYPQFLKACVGPVLYGKSFKNFFFLIT